MNELALKYGCNPNQKPSRIYLEDGSDPVSYTHLDVYKRQIQAWPQAWLVSTTTGRWVILWSMTLSLIHI